MVGAVGGGIRGRNCLAVARRLAVAVAQQCQSGTGRKRLGGACGSVVAVAVSRGRWLGRNARVWWRTAASRCWPEEEGGGDIRPVRDGGGGWPGGGGSRLGPWRRRSTRWQWRWRSAGTMAMVRRCNRGSSGSGQFSRRLVVAATCCPACGLRQLMRRTRSGRVHWPLNGRVPINGLGH